MYVVQTVVTLKASQQPEHVYRDLCHQPIPCIQFVPKVVLDEEGHPAPDSVTAEAWGHFLKTVFDIWVREDIGRTSVALFDDTLSVWRGGYLLADAEERLAEECRHCPVLRFCHGGCPEHRGREGKSVLCAGYWQFFTYSAPYMRVMRDLLKQRRSPVELMIMLQPH